VSEPPPRADTADWRSSSRPGARRPARLAGPVDLLVSSSVSQHPNTCIAASTGSRGFGGGCSRAVGNDLAASKVGLEGSLVLPGKTAWRQAAIANATPHTTVGVCAGQLVRCDGPDGPGTRWGHTGRAPQHRILEGLSQGTPLGQLRAGPRRTWTTNSQRHRDQGPADPRAVVPMAGGIFQPARLLCWDGFPGLPR
jgi:hypothetical protein